MQGRKSIQHLRIIKMAKEDERKSTAECHLKAAPKDYKNKVIVKCYRLGIEQVRRELLSRQVKEVYTPEEVCQIKETFIEEDGKDLYLILVEEYQQHGNLTEVIEVGRQVDYQLISNIALSLRQLHLRNICHLNLKPQNILLQPNHAVKFSDVSIAHISSIFRKSPIQQTSYLPPESLEYAVGDWQTDIWSLGIIYLEMLLNRHIEVSEATLEEVSKLIGSIPHKGIQVLLGGMCTVRNRRFTIEEVIKVVNRIRNDPEVESEEEESQCERVRIRIPLFPCKNVEKTHVSCFQSGDYNLKVKEWMVQFRLYRAEPIASLWLILQRKGTVNCSISRWFSSLPQHLLQHFSSLEQLFEQIKITEVSSFSIQNDGSLTCEIKVASVFVQKPLVQTKQEEISAAKEETIEQSDIEQDLTKAYLDFPQTSQKISRMIDTLKIAANAKELDYELIATLYQSLGMELGDNYQFSRRAFKLGIQGFRKFGKDSERQMNLLVNLGVLYGRYQRYEKAIECFKKCIHIAQFHDDVAVLVLSYRNWGGVSLYREDYQTAEDCFKQCLEISRETPAKDYELLSSVYLRRKDYRNSNLCIEKGLKAMGEQRGDRCGVLNFNWGFGLLELGEFKAALIKFEKAMGLIEKQSLKRELQLLLLSELSDRMTLLKPQWTLHEQFLSRLKKRLSLQSQRKFQYLPISGV